MVPREEGQKIWKEVGGLEGERGGGVEGEGGGGVKWKEQGRRGKKGDGA